MADDGSPGMKTTDPLFLFNIFQSDVIGAEIDWQNERFLFYPVRRRSAVRTERHRGPGALRSGDPTADRPGGRGRLPPCYVRMRRSLVQRDGETEVRGKSVLAGRWVAESVCVPCGSLVSVPVELALGGHPVVVTLLAANGDDPRDRHVWGEGPPVEWGVGQVESDVTAVVESVSVAGDRAEFLIEAGWTVTVIATPDWIDWPSE